jgi:hypothetical protein
MSEHLARHVLERLLVDDPRDALAPDARAHLSACAPCAARMQAIVLARGEYAAGQPAAQFARAVAERAAARQDAPSVLRWPARRWAAGCAALAAAAVIALALRGALSPSGPDAIRYKGPAAALQVYVRSGAQMHALRQGEGLRAGDQLAFTYTLSQPQHLLLYGIDDAGTVTRYFPDPALAPAGTTLPAGVTRQLPIGIELDARRGRERLVALFSPAPLDEARARAALAAALQAARTRGDGIAELGELSLPAAQASVWFDKP